MDLAAEQIQYEKDGHCPRRGGFCMPFVQSYRNQQNMYFFLSCVSTYDIRKSYYRWINAYSVLHRVIQKYICVNTSLEKSLRK